MAKRRVWPLGCVNLPRAQGAFLLFLASLNSSCVLAPGYVTDEFREADPATSRYEKKTDENNSDSVRSVAANGLRDHGPD